MSNGSDPTDLDLDHIQTNVTRKDRTMANASKTYTPKELASAIGVDPKVLRGYLRATHTRPNEAKNTSWIIPESVAVDCRKHFAKNVATEAKS